MMYKRLRLAFISTTLAAASITSTPSHATLEPFIGQVILFGGNFCPRGWVKAEGQILPISQYTALFSLLGTFYGGDGYTDFALPDLRGRAPVSQGTGPGLNQIRQGSTVGSETQQILVQNMPEHNHRINATNTQANKGGPGDKYFAASSTQKNTPPFFYSTEAPNRQMAMDTVSNVGGSQPMNIQAPRLAMQYCIAFTGIYPSPN